MKKILLKDVKQAEKEYGIASTRWGSGNLVTQRAFIKWHELKKEYEKRR